MRAPQFVGKAYFESKGGRTMTYSKPEVRVLGNAAHLIEGIKTGVGDSGSLSQEQAESTE